MRKTLPVIIILLVFHFSSFAQQNLSMYELHSLHQSSFANPAFIPSSKMTIGFPVLGSIYFNYSNNGFAYSDFVRHSQDDSLYLDMDNLVNTLSDKNYITTSLHSTLISIGFKIKKCYVSLDANEKLNFRFGYTKQMMDFINRGNGAFLGQDVDLGFDLDMTHYREYTIGFSMPVKKFIIGARYKFLRGMQNASTAQNTIIVNTNPNTFDVTVRPDLLINSSGFNGNIVSGFGVSDYFMNSGNNGSAFDLGIQYKMNDHWNFSASAIDLGKINWKNKVTNYRSNVPNNEFVYYGIDLNQFVNDSTSIDAAFHHVLDSLSNTLGIDTLHESYSTTLPVQYYLEAKYFFNEKNALSILMYQQRFNGEFFPAYSLGFTKRIGKVIEGTLNYSYAYRGIGNIGLGLSFTSQPTQYYILSDNILGFASPENARMINLRFGINMLFGSKD